MCKVKCFHLHNKKTIKTSQNAKSMMAPCFHIEDSDRQIDKVKLDMFHVYANS